MSVAMPSIADVESTISTVAPDGAEAPGNPIVPLKALNEGSGWGDVAAEATLTCEEFVDVVALAVGEALAFCVGGTVTGVVGDGPLLPPPLHDAALSSKAAPKSH